MIAPVDYDPKNFTPIPLRSHWDVCELISMLIHDPGRHRLQHDRELRELLESKEDSWLRSLHRNAIYIGKGTGEMGSGSIMGDRFAELIAAVELLQGQRKSPPHAKAQAEESQPSTASHRTQPHARAQG